MTQTFDIAAAGTAQWLALCGISVFCLLLAAFSWRLRPSSRAAAGIVTGAVLLSLGIAAVFAWFALGQARSRIELEGGELRFEVPMYARAVPLERVIVERIEIVSLDGDPEYRLAGRTNGLGLPGYALGWFDTRGAGRALVALTTRDAVAIPTLDGYTLLVSAVEPAALAAALRRRDD